MKAILSSILFLMVLVTNMYPESKCTEPDVTTEASVIEEAKHTRKKTIRKEFDVKTNGDLNINNSYGNIDIVTWKEDRVLIEVTIKTNGNDEDDVEDKLDDIRVEFDQNSSGVTATTKFSKENKSWWKNIFDGFDNVNMEVNYVIRAPENNNLTLDNNYGGIYIDKTFGNTDINCDYGKIDIGELNGRSNILNFDYSRSSRIGFVTNAEIDADYSDYEIGEAEELLVNADYTKSRIRKVTKLDFNCDYGSIEINKVKVLIGNGDYLTTKVDRIFTSADINLDYGSLHIDKIVNGTKSVNIDTDYAGVHLGYDREMAFSFDVETSYGGINGTEDLDVRRTNEKNTSKSISGNYGSGSGARIDISTSYGSVKFSKE